MKKNKVLFAAVLAAVVLGIGSIGVYAAVQVAQNNSISEETARNFAFVDAGISPEEANVIKTEFDFEKGKFVYEIDFLTEDTKYEYTIDAKSGAVLGKETEILSSAAGQSTNQNSNTAEEPVPTEKTAQTQKPASTEKLVQTQTAEPSVLGIEEAKAIALSDAGISVDEAVFSKAKQDHENGQIVYEIDFYINGQWEYEYEIDAVTGAILEKSQEPWVAPEKTTETVISVPSEQQTPPAPETPAQPAPSITEQPAPQPVVVDTDDYDDDDYDDYDDEVIDDVDDNDNDDTEIDDDYDDVDDVNDIDDENDDDNDDVDEDDDDEDEDDEEDD